MKRSTYLLTGLHRLYAELAGELRHKEAERDAIVENLRSVERVIKLVEPDFDAKRVMPLRRQRPQLFPRKAAQYSRLAIEILRGADRPLSVEQIVSTMVQQDRWSGISHEDVVRMRNAVRSWLTYNAGKIVVAHGRYPSRWTLIAE